jgi:c(7)-type cytochrome triheme protein
MRSYVLVFLALGLAGCQSGGTAGSKTSSEEKKPALPYIEAQPAGLAKGYPPDTILIRSPYGYVTYTHKKHYERVNGDCTTCHPKVFPQALEPLNYKKAQHRAAEGTMTSCAYCHVIGGSAFAADSNCTKCHAEREH